MRKYYFFSIGILIICFIHASICPAVIDCGVSKYSQFVGSCDNGDNSCVGVCWYGHWQGCFELNDPDCCFAGISCMEDESESILEYYERECEQVYPYCWPDKCVSEETGHQYSMMPTECSCK